MNKKVSVIVPVYKVENYLAQCIESIINQSYKNLEIILVEDGSPDNCPKICDEWSRKDNRVKVIHKENGGVSSARNIGIESATGDFIAFVDADDYIESNMYELLMKKQAEGDFDLVFSRFKTIYKDHIDYHYEESLEDLCKNNNVGVILNYSNPYERHNDVIVDKQYVMASIWRILFKKEVIKKHKFNSNIKIMEDTVFLAEIFLKENCKANFIDEYCYNYVSRVDSAMHKPNLDVLQSCIIMVDEFQRILFGTRFEEYIDALKFFGYGICVKQKYNMGVNVNLKTIKYWNTRQTYKAYKKIPTNMQAKVKFFCIHHKLNFIVKLLYKLKKED